jgi:ribosomal protein S18 acetylase RimI-like enzyme
MISGSLCTILVPLTIIASCARLRSTRVGYSNQSLAPEFQSLECLRSANRRKVLEPVVESLTCDQRIEEAPDRHARPDEHGCATHDLGVRVHNLFFRRVHRESYCSLVTIPVGSPSVPMLIRPLRKYEIADLAHAIPDELTEGQVANRWREQEIGFREVLVAEVDGAIVGTVSIRKTQDTWPSMHLFALEVAPQHRGHGIGRTIVQHVVEEARQRGCVRVFLEVRVDNPARRLYHRLGFRRVGKAFVNSWWHFDDNGGQRRVEELSYRMVKRIRPVAIL